MMDRLTRLTDRKIAQKLKEKVESQVKAGIMPDKNDLIYIKLADIENREELEYTYYKNKLYEMQAHGMITSRDDWY